MKNTFRILSVEIQSLLSRDEGQDLIEYAFLFALIAFAATAGMRTMADDINSAFVTVGTTLTAAV